MTWGQKTAALIGLVLVLLALVVMFAPFTVATDAVTPVPVDPTSLAALRSDWATGKGPLPLERPLTQYNCGPALLRVTHGARNDAEQACWSDSVRRSQEGTVVIGVTAVGVLGALLILRPRRRLAVA